MGTQIQLTEEEELKSSRGDKIDSDIYYTMDGSEPTKDNGKKYDPAKKIVLDRVGRYTVKAKLLSQVGKYEGDIFSETYKVVKPPPPIPTITSPNQLDKKIRKSIYSETKVIRFDFSKIDDVKKSGGKIRVKLFISHLGKGKVMEIHGIEVEPGDKLEILHESLGATISKIEFGRPTKGNNPINVEIWIDFKKIGKYENKIILTRE